MKKMSLGGWLENKEAHNTSTNYIENLTNLHKDFKINLRFGQKANRD